MTLTTYTLTDSVALITINRPDKRNALSQALIAELSSAFQRAKNDDSVRCVLLTGSGTVFCAGMDLDELRSKMQAEYDEVWQDAQRLSALYELIYTLPKPTIAVVNGVAVAGGAGLMTVCDLALTVSTAKFGYPEVRRGLVAAMVMPHLLRHVGERAARWMLLSGELIDADEALRIGLVNKIVPADQLLPSAYEWCKSIIAGGPKALAKTKELLAHSANVGMDELAKASAEPRLTDECQAGLQAFFEKRDPPWLNGK